MKNFINTLTVILTIAVIAAFIFLVITWIDLSQRTELAEKKIVEVQTELYECRQETETFADIVINKRWE